MDNTILISTFLLEIVILVLWYRLPKFRRAVPLLEFGADRPLLPELKNIFLDLETYSTQPTACILAIGAVCVDSSGREISRIKILVDIKNSMRYGHVCPRTKQWWDEQSSGAKRLTFSDGLRYPLATSLVRFGDWFKSMGEIDGIWGNGARFDCGILANAYHATQLSLPWEHWQERDVRTAVALGLSLFGIDYRELTPFEGVRHNCIDDAAHQAKYTTAILKAFR